MPSVSGAVDPTGCWCCQSMRRVLSFDGASAVAAAVLSVFRETPVTTLMSFNVNRMHLGSVKGKVRVKYSG